MQTVEDGTLQNTMTLEPNGVIVRDNLHASTMGVGTTRTEGTLHVHTATAGTVVADTTADDLVVESSGNTGISILSPDASLAKLMFGAPEDADRANLTFDGSTDLFSLKTSLAGAEMRFMSANGVEAVRIDANQDVGIGVTTVDARLHISDTAALLTKWVYVAANASAAKFDIYKNSTSPADDDVLFNQEISGNTDDGAGGVTSSDVAFGNFKLTATNTGNAAKASEWQFQTRVANSVTQRLFIGAGLWTKNATGGDKGVDSINVSTYFTDGTAGVSGSGTNVTCVNGIVTAIS